MKNNLLTKLDKKLPNALLVMGIGGVFVTTYFAVEATFKAVEHIQEAKKNKEEVTGETKLEPKEVVKACAKDYRKTAVALTATVACVACAYSEESRRATLATGSFYYLEQILNDNYRYQEKLENAVGPKKTKQLREEYDVEKAQELRGEPIEYSESKFRPDDEVVIICDVNQHRRFYSTKNNVINAFTNFKAEAINDITEDAFGFMDGVKDTYVKPWNDLNAELGIGFSEMGHEWGYPFDDIQKLHPRLTASETDEGQLCWALSYNLPTVHV